MEKETYLLRVSRYIHLNPVVANMTEDPASYEWSGYSSYIGSYKYYEWLYIDEILRQTEDQESYQKYVEYGVDNEIEKIYSQKYYPPILGDNSFKLKQLKRLEPNKTEESIPDIKRTKNLPSVEFIIEQIAAYFDISCDKIFISRRGIENLPRILTMFVCRYFFGHKLSEIAACISGIKPTAISSIVKKSVSLTAVSIQAILSPECPCLNATLDNKMLVYHPFCKFYLVD